MRVLRWLCVLVVVSFTAVSCTRRESEDSREVVLYSSIDEPYLRPLIQRFEQQTGIKVLLATDQEATKTAGLAERLEAERANPRADVYWGNEIFHTIRLADAGALEPYRPASAEDVPAKWRDPLDRYVDIGLRIRVLVLSTRPENRDLAAKVKGVADFSRPELKDKIGISHPGFGTASGYVAGLYVKLGPDKFRDLMRSWRASGVKLLGGNSVVADQVAAGNLVAGLTDNDDVANGKADGQPIDAVLPDQDGLGTLLIPTTIALVKGAPHSGAGKKLIDFLSSPDVEKELIAKNFLAYSVHGDVPVRGMDVDYTELSRQMPAAVQATLDILQDRTTN